MGWQSDDGTHEGFLAAMLNEDGRWRELGASDEITTPVYFVRVACECGWRSPLIAAPSGTRFVPSVVLADESFSDEAARLWDRHVTHSGPASDDGYSIQSLLATRGA